MKSRVVIARLSPEFYQGFEALGAALNLNKTDTLKQIIREAVTRHIDPSCCLARVALNEGFHCVINAPEAVKLGDGSLHDAALICETCKKIGRACVEAT